MQTTQSRIKSARDLLSGDNIEIKDSLVVVLTVRHNRDTVTVGSTAGMLTFAPDDTVTELVKSDRY